MCAQIKSPDTVQVVPIVVSVDLVTQSGLDMPKHSARGTYLASATSTQLTAFVASTLTRHPIFINASRI